MVTGGGTAQAATNVNAYEPAGAEAWGTVSWLNNGNSFKVTGRGLSDTECDGNQVYVQVVYKPYSGDTQVIKANRKSDGCGSVNLADVRWDASGRPKQVWITVCEDNWGGDDCSDSRPVPNPYN
jgi:hypothetical protein